MEVFMYSTGTKKQLTVRDMLSACGYISFSNVHHEDRNSPPDNAEKTDAILSPFHGDSYRSHMDHLFQTRKMASAPTVHGTPCTEDKEKRLETEMRFWDAFSERSLYTEETSVFDIGVCGAGAECGCEHSCGPYRCTLQDAICLSIESKRTKLMLAGLDIGKVDPSMKSFQEAFYGPGMPSPFLLSRAVRTCGNAIVAGCSGYVSRTTRLVLEDEYVGWLSDLHASYDLRRTVLCAHYLQSAGQFDRSGQPERLSEQFMPISVPPLPCPVLRHTNRICRILRGVRCQIRIGIHRPPQTSMPFTEARSRWMAVRELIEMQNEWPEPIESFDERPASQIFNALTCGIEVWTCWQMGQWKNNTAFGINLEDLLESVKSGEFDIAAFLDQAKNLKAIELLAWADMILKFRIISKADEHGGLFSIDIGDLNVFKDAEAAASTFSGISQDEEVDDALDRLILAVTGVDDIEKLEPLCLASEYTPGEKLAAHFDNLRWKTTSAVGDKIEKRKGWLIPERTERKVNLFRDNVRYIAQILPSKDIVCYKHSRSRHVLRAIGRVFKGVNVLGHGVQVDLTSIFEAGAEDTSNSMNDLLGGTYGLEGVRYGLRLIFSGVVRVRRGHGTPTCYVPEIAHDEAGVVLTAFLPRKIMAKATYFERNGKVYWLAGKNVNFSRLAPDRNQKRRTLRRSKNIQK